MTSAAELFRNRAKARVGTTVRDKWRLDALLGIGGTAAVYAATHRNGKRVAMKILRSELASYEEVTTRFAREGYVANKIQHPGVVSVLDDDLTEDGAPFLVMELLEGHSLDRYTKGPSSALPAPRVVHIVDRILDVLAVAHDSSVIHRDIKPANVFLERNDDVKVLDFGIARIVDGLDGGMTQTGTAIGTPGYMAPEQARGRWSEVDARTDLWAVGATMYALLIGQRPRRAETVQEELLAAMTQPMRPIREVLGTLPPGLAAFVDRAVAFEREQRFPDARAMQLALRAASAEANPAPGPSSLKATVPLVPSAEPTTRAAPLPDLSVDYVDEVTVASAPSWASQDDLVNHTNYPFTLPSNPIAEPVQTVPSAQRSKRGAYLVGGAVALAAALAFVLFGRRHDDAPSPTAEPPGAAAAAPAPVPSAPSEPAAEPLHPPAQTPTDEPALPTLEASNAPAPSAVPAPRKDSPKGGTSTSRPVSNTKPNEGAKADPCKDPMTAPPSCFK